MNGNKVLVGIGLALLIALAVFQARQTSELKETVAGLARDRDDLKRQMKDLSRRVGASEADIRPPAQAGEPPAAGPTRLTAPVAAPVAVAAPFPAENVPVPGVTTKAPTGWGKNGSKVDAYVVGVDENNSYNGTPSAYVKSVQPNVDGFGGMMQTISAEDYVGKRIRLTGMVKSEEANDGGGHLWLRIDPQGGGQPVGFDNMDNRPVKGTTDWQPASIVLDVPANARALAYGMFVAGSGQMWANGIKIEEVGPEVPVTDMRLPQNAPPLPKAPQNPSFQ